MIGDERERPRTPRGDHLLSGLNEVQRKAATHREGPLVVFAGAGSGKTRIITHRIAWLIESGVAPWEILAVTFTNKAAAEMKARVEALTPLSNRCLIATFHSACARWLREFAPELGFTSDFTIYTDDDQVAALKTVLAELNVKLDDQTSVNEFKQAINKAKTMAMLPNDERLGREYAGLMPVAGQQVYKRYQEYLAACNAMDFGDLIMNMLLLLRRNETVRSLLQRRYRYILVDEYQDTNRTQFELIARLSEASRNLFVVGDDDQSIYSWRGAVPSNIIDFDKVYPDAVRVTMEQNYRSSGHIVAAASAMIQNNKHRVAKRPFTDNDLGERIDYRLETDNELEAWWVIDRIKREQARFPLADVAVFYRTNAQSRMLEDALRRDNLPYRIYGTVRFYDRAEIKDVMAWFRIAVNPTDDVSLKRIVNVPPRGIGDKALATIEAEAARRGQSLYKTIEQMAEENVARLGPKLRELVQLVGSLRADLLEGAVEDAVQTVLDATQYVEFVKKKFPDAAADKVENIHELGAALADFASAYPDSTIAEWLQTVTLVSSEEGSGGGVTLMTLHMAKGLEFRRVYLVGLEENVLPHRNSVDDPSSLEEERRLFYVGMTRAKEKLSLVGAYRRRTYNAWAANRPSRFLAEIPAEHFEPSTELESAQLRTSRYGDGWDEPSRYEYDEVPSTPTLLEIGQKVTHPTYGGGVVEELHDEFGVIKAVVRFREFGLRKVLAKHLEG
jgi:DNA helicase-2/ATP-dependent DNA helicase PcrA